MTEDDTFNRLKRVPFRELFISLLDPILIGSNIIPNDRNSAITEAGWNIDEFRAVVDLEIEKGNITGSVTSLSDLLWREEFLKKEKIY